MLSTRMTPIIDSFKGEWEILSNFYMWYDGNDVYSVEHWFQAFKSWDVNEQLHVLAARTPREAKNRGRAATLREDWDEVKDDIMLELLRAKFNVPEHAEKLLATGDAVLIEGNNWNDWHFGAVRTPKGKPAVRWDGANGKPWYGENVLGKLLMQVREELRP